jgi:hypothetical protein
MTLVVGARAARQKPDLFTLSSHAQRAWSEFRQIQQGFDGFAWVRFPSPAPLTSFAVAADGSNPLPRGLRRRPSMAFALRAAWKAVQLRSRRSCDSHYPLHRFARDDGRQTAGTGRTMPPICKARGERVPRHLLCPAHDSGSGSRSSPILGGSGMNSPLSRSGSFMRPACQSSRAWSMRSFDDDTKFQSM